MGANILTDVQIAAQFVQLESELQLEVTEENAADIKRRFFELLAESERAQRPATYGPETEDEYYSRLTSELGGFSEGMVIDPVFDLDILDRLNPPTPGWRGKRGSNDLAQHLIASNDPKMKEVLHRILRANEDWCGESGPLAIGNRTGSVVKPPRLQMKGYRSPSPKEALGRGPVVRKNVAKH